MTLLFFLNGEKKLMVDMTTWILIVSAFLVSLLIAPKWIKILKRKQFKQYIREDGPKEHAKKTGTPTLGAVIFIMPALVLFIIFSGIDSKESYFLFFLALSFALIGGLDDFIKVFKKQNEGLTSKQKLFLQLGYGVIATILLMANEMNTSVWIPFVNLNIDLKLLYPVFVLLMIVGASNATNLTDGVDGLLTGTAIVSFLTFALIAHSQGNQTVFTLAILFVASLSAFLLFNFNPAKVFMGDMGSLALGALMAGMAIVLKVELLLLLIGLVYVLETLSVILQVVSFKITKKRIFKMSPVHHHFELSGMNERNIFVLFVTIQLIASGISVLVINYK